MPIITGFTRWVHCGETNKDMRPCSFVEIVRHTRWRGQEVYRLDYQYSLWADVTRHNPHRSTKKTVAQIGSAESHFAQRKDPGFPWTVRLRDELVIKF